MNWQKTINLFSSGYLTKVAIIVIIFWLPLYVKWLPQIMIVAILLFILQKKRKLQFTFLLQNKGVFLLVLFYFAHIVGLLYSKNTSSALFDLEVKLSFLVFPVLFLFTKVLDDSRFVYRTHNAFIVGNIIASLICLIIALYNSIENRGDGFLNISIWESTRDLPFLELIIKGYSFFNYSSLSYFHHPSYFGIYLLFALYLSYFSLKRNKINITPFIRGLYISSIFIFTIMILLLQSRAVIISAFMIIIFEIIRSFVNNKNIITRLVPSIIGITSIFIYIFLAGRFNLEKITSSKHKIEELKKSDIRFEIWEKSMNILYDNIMFGVGIGDVKDELIKQYDIGAVKIAKEKGLNAHNQFIETALGLGLYGEIILLLILIYPFFNKSNYLDSPHILIFSIIFIFVFMFESVFNRIAGVSFFSLFYTLLNYNKNSE